MLNFNTFKIHDLSVLLDSTLIIHSLFLTPQLRQKRIPTVFLSYFAVDRRVATLLYDVPFSVIPPSTRLYLYEYKISTYTLYSLNIPRNNIRLLGFAADSFQHIITFSLFLIPFRLSSLSEISPFLPIE